MGMALTMLLTYCVICCGRGANDIRPARDGDVERFSRLLECLAQRDSLRFSATIEGSEMPHSVALSLDRDFVILKRSW